MPKTAYLFQSQLKGPQNRKIEPGERIKFNGSSTDAVIEAHDGIITISQPGSYLIHWSVAQSTGMATNGANFALQAVGYDPTDTHIIGSNHVKISNANGFALLEWYQKLWDNQILSIELVNYSNDAAVLSSRTEVLASLMVFGINMKDFINFYELNQAHIPLAAAHLVCDDPSGIGILVASGMPIPFNQFAAYHEFDYTDLNITYHTLLLPVSTDPGYSNRFLVNWNVTIKASDYAERVALQLQFSPNITGPWNSPVTMVGNTPLPIGHNAGSVIIQSDPSSKYMRLIYNARSITKKSTKNYNFDYLTFYKHWVFATTNITALPAPPIGHVYERVGLTSYFISHGNFAIPIGGSITLIHSLPTDTHSKVKVVVPTKADDVVHLLVDEDEVQASGNPLAYSQLFIKDTYQPYLSNTFKNVYVHLPYSSNRMLVCDSTNLHTYPFSQTVMGHMTQTTNPNITNTFVSVIAAGMFHDEVVYATILEEVPVSPSIQIENGAELTITQLPHKEFIDVLPTV